MHENWDNTYRHVVCCTMSGEQVQWPHERIVGYKQIGVRRTRRVDGDEGLQSGQLHPRRHLLPRDIDANGVAVLEIHANAYEDMALARR